jgi:hypothetical protein
MHPGLPWRGPRGCLVAEGVVYDDNLEPSLQSGQLVLVGLAG